MIRVTWWVSGGGSKDANPLCLATTVAGVKVDDDDEDDGVVELLATPLLPDTL